MNKEIPLTKGYKTVVDAIDYEWAIRWNWFTMETTSGRVYAVRKERIEGKRKTVYLHRKILSRKLERELLSEELTDHIRGVGLDNRRSNLRLATLEENIRNQGKHKDSKSPFKGISWNKNRNKWQVQIRTNGRVKYLGRFMSPRDAAIAYYKAAIKYFGEFAVTNESLGFLSSWDDAMND